MAGTAAYDIMLGQIPGMKSMKSEEALKQPEGAGKVGAKLNWLPTPEELADTDPAHVEEHKPHMTKGSCDEAGNGAWSQLLRLSARPLAKPESQGAIEDKATQLCLEDCLEKKSHVTHKPLAIMDVKPEAAPGVSHDNGSPQPHDTPSEPQPHDAPSEPQPHDAPSEPQPHDAPSEQVNAQPCAASAQLSEGNAGPPPNEGSDPESSPKRRRITKKTFAARYRPTGKVQGAKFDAIKESFLENIRMKIKGPSVHEDSFFKFCMKDLNYIIHVHQLETETPEVLKLRVDGLALRWLDLNTELLK
jgi:hypothetical protein